MKLKAKNWKDVIKFADFALEVDHKCEKALYLKGKAFIELTDYNGAIETLQDLVEFHPDSQEGKKEFERAQKLQKQYNDKTSEMCKRMFN